MPAKNVQVDGSALNAPIATARLRIEPLGARHAALLFDGMQDPAIYRWISMRQSPSVAHQAERWARVERDVLAVDGVFELGWAVQRVADGAWIGKMDAEVQADGIATNVGYFFLPAYWGRGHASEAVAALCAHFARQGVIEQRATVTLGNDASCRVLERAGFVRGRVLPGNDTLRGALVDDIEYVRRD